MSVYHWGPLLTYSKKSLLNTSWSCFGMHAACCTYWRKRINLSTPVRKSLAKGTSSVQSSSGAPEQLCSAALWRNDHGSGWGSSSVWAVRKGAWEAQYVVRRVNPCIIQAVHIQCEAVKKPACSASSLWGSRFCRKATGTRENDKELKKTIRSLHYMSICLYSPPNMDEGKQQVQVMQKWISGVKIHFFLKMKGNEGTWKEMKGNEGKWQEMLEKWISAVKIHFLENERKWRNMRRNERKWRKMTGNARKMNFRSQKTFFWKHERKWRNMKRNERKWRKMTGNARKMNFRSQKSFFGNMKGNEATWKEMKGNEGKWQEMLEKWISGVKIHFLEKWKEMREHEKKWTDMKENDRKC